MDTLQVALLPLTIIIIKSVYLDSFYLLVFLCDFLLLDYFCLYYDYLSKFYFLINFEGRNFSRGWDVDGS